MQRILHVVGARPNFMKIAPIMKEMGHYPEKFQQHLVHTGQHYDETMSKVFFDDLDLPLPDINLKIGSGTHAWQTGQIMQQFEPVVLDYRPDWVIVPGDVNSTLACALVATKLGVKVAHIEAGLRSFDRTMPEEINRILTDHIADLLFTTEPSANENLRREGIPAHKIHYVGNVMIDTLTRLLPHAHERWPYLQRDLELLHGYMLVTLHRPSNVDDFETLYEITNALGEISHEIMVVFPMHPRTRQRLRADVRLRKSIAHLRLIEPLRYLDFLSLQSHATLVLTDSGGVQEETTYLNIPCLTVRPNTERPITIEKGSNQLVQSKKEPLVAAIRDALCVPVKATERPELWDGQTAKRVVEIFQKE
jgi:UDP-N-acetylglucosamine 2-epimerase (non-hydrolysing)